MIRRLCLALLMAVTVSTAMAGQPAVTSIGVEGTEIVVGLADGRSLRSKDLVGAVLDVRFQGQPAKVRIVAVEPDPIDGSGTVWLHTLEVRQPDGVWRNLCAAGPDGRQQGFPLEGMAQGLDFTCSSGAVGKCVRFGYRPWAADAAGRRLAPYQAACIRMLRGDYGGTGEAWTKDGMRIDGYDRAGIQAPDDLPDLTFEAGWSPEGAVCVHHVRVKENVTLAALEEKYTRLRGQTGAICTEDYARKLGAIIFNHSAP